MDKLNVLTANELADGVRGKVRALEADYAGQQMEIASLDAFEKEEELRPEERAEREALQRGVKRLKARIDTHLAELAAIEASADETPARTRRSGS